MLKIEEHGQIDQLVLCVPHDVHSRKFFVVAKIEQLNQPLAHQCHEQLHPVYKKKNNYDIKIKFITKL